MLSASTSESREFRSPQRKLVRFFQKSRDNWKWKCQQAKQRCKLLANQVRAVEKSREQWRAEAEAARRRVEELEQTLAEQKRDELDGPSTANFHRAIPLPVSHPRFAWRAS